MVEITDVDPSKQSKAENLKSTGRTCTQKLLSREKSSLWRKQSENVEHKSVSYALELKKILGVNLPAQISTVFQVPSKYDT